MKLSDFPLPWTIDVMMITKRTGNTVLRSTEGFPIALVPGCQEEDMELAEDLLRAVEVYVKTEGASK